MTETPSLSACLQQLGRTLAARDLGALTDVELIRRFAANRDEAAFTALVQRYGRVVHGVCRRLLRQEQDAEDAFQATFLVLARHAASVGRTGAIGSWLYGVAFNVARKARAMRQRREIKEREAAAQRPTQTDAPGPNDLQPILDEELQALAEKYRTAIVLCDLRGLTIREAAAEVRCPPKTLGTRLGRGRALLAQRLARRGVSLAAGALAAFLASSASAMVPARWIGSTVRAALGFVAGSSSLVAHSLAPTVAVLTEGVTPLMVPKACKCLALLLCGALILAGMTAVSQAHQPRSAKVVTETSPAAAPLPGPARKEKPPHVAVHDVFYRIFVQVLAPALTHHFLTQNVLGTLEEKETLDLSGTWQRKDGNIAIEFCEKKTLKISAHKGALVVVTEYTVEKDGPIKAKITGLEGTDDLKDKAKEKLPVGLAFSFVWKVKDGVAKLDDVKGDNTELLKSHLEGDFEMKK